MKITLALVAAVITAGGVTLAQGQSSSPSQGQGASAAEVVKARQQGLKTLGAAFKTIRDELRGDSPDAAKIRSAAADITHAASAIGKWFPSGTGPDSGVKTDAKPEVWTNWPDFSKRMNEFAQKTAEVAKIAREKGKEAAMTNVLDALPCKPCHEKYRTEKKN